jgi:hypothetical protein
MKTLLNCNRIQVTYVMFVTSLSIDLLLFQTYFQPGLNTMLGLEKIFICQSVFVHFPYNIRIARWNR